MSYTKIGWQDEPSTRTPISATKLNHMDNEIKTSSDKVDLILGDLASKYSTSKKYAVGDYCIYNSKLYKCTTAIAKSEAWTSAHWTNTNCGTEFSTLNTSLQSANAKIGTLSTNLSATTTKSKTNATNISALFGRKTYTYTASNIASMKSTFLKYSSPSGYSPVSIKVKDKLWWQVSLSYDGYVFLLNTDGVTKNETVKVDIYFVKDSLLKAL